jgi:hypothetical protein
MKNLKGEELLRALSTSSTPYAILYKGANYTGTQWTIFYPYDFNSVYVTGADVPDEDDPDEMNDAITSVQVFNGASIRLYEHHNFTGSTLDVSSNVANLGNFDNRTSSIFWLNNQSCLQPNDPTPYVELYTGINYGGNKYTIPYPIDRNTFYNTSYNNNISSLKVSNGAQIVLYADHNNSGTSSGTISTNISNLASIGFDNISSSLEWLNQGCQ